MTLKQLKNESIKQLSAAGNPNPGCDFSLILKETADIDETQIITEPDKEVSEDICTKIQSVLNRYSQGEPLAYILGKTEFMGLPFICTPPCLIPRPDTERVVEYAIKYITPDSSVLDLCCGSGCIGISIKKLTGCKNVTLSDVADYALNLSNKNSRLNNVEVKLIQSNLFHDINEKYDVIVSNPPYISAEEMKHLDNSVLEYESEIALCGGDDGLYFYRRIIEEAHNYLNDNGLLVFEIGYNQADSVRKLIDECPTLEYFETFRDYGGNYRGISARKI